LPQDVGWAAIADPAATAIAHMPRRTMPALRDAALRHGLDPAAPAILMANISRPDERRPGGAVASLPELAGTLTAEGPALVLIGHALANAAGVGEEGEGRRAQFGARG
jgi:siroheme synthase